MSLSRRCHIPPESNIKWYSAMKSHVLFAIQAEAKPETQRKVMPVINPNPKASKRRRKASLPLHRDAFGPKSKSVTSRIGC